jgi:hypothetical protein
MGADVDLAALATDGFLGDGVLLLAAGKQVGNREDATYGSTGCVPNEVTTAT